MLREVPSDGNIIPGIVSRIRSALARNIALRNPDVRPPEFPGIADQLIFAIIAVRLLEEAGVIRGPGVDRTVLDKGLSEGLSLIFQELANNDRMHAGYRGLHNLHPDMIPVPRVFVDPGIVEEVLRLTRGKEFSGEWITPGSDNREAALVSFTGWQVRLREGNRAVIEEKQVTKGHSGHGILPGAYIRQVTGEMLAKRLSGLSPVTRGLLTILDPCCGTGRFLISAYRFLLDWHRSWYLQHLVPLIEEGRDPASRRVQQMIPPVQAPPGPSPGRIFGFSPLPVCRNENDEWVLTWEEKVRIFATSMYGVDIEQQSVTMARLSFLSALLNDPLSHEISSFSPCTVFGSLFWNIRCGNTLAGPGYSIHYADPIQALPPPEENADWQGFSFEESFPEVMEAGGFDLVLGRYPEGLGRPGKRVHDYLAGYYLTRKKTGLAAPFFIERGISLLRDGGCLCMTGDGTWLQDPACAPLRLWLRQFRIDEVVDFRDHPLLKKINRHFVLVAITRHPNDRPLKAVIASEVPGDLPGRYMPRWARQVSGTMLSDGPWVLHDVSPDTVRATILEKGTALSRVIMGEYIFPRCKVPQWAVIDRKTFERIARKDPVAKSWLLPYARKEDISRYGSVKTGYYLISIPGGTTRALAGATDDLWGWFNSCHHTLAGILERQAGMKDKQVRGSAGRCWWEWPGDPVPGFIRNRVILFRPGDDPHSFKWTIAPAGAFPGPEILAIPGRDPAILGILNSKLFAFFLITSGRRSGKARYIVDELLEFPVYIPDPDNPGETRFWHELALLVKRRLALRSGLATPLSGDVPAVSGDAGRCEDRIDHLVARLYGLSDDDIMVADYWLSRSLTKKEVPGGSINQTVDT